MAIDGEIFEVLHGKKGRLFLGKSPFFDAEGLVSGISPFLNAWRFRIESLAAALGRRGHPLFLFIAPEAHSVYSEDLPENVARPEISVGQRLVDSLRDTPNVYPVFPLQVLREAKGGVDVYPRNDTHWSAYGAYLAYRELCNALSSRRPVEPIPARDVRYEFKFRFGNLGSVAEPEMRIETPIAVLPQIGSLVTSERSYLRNYYHYAVCPYKQGSLLAAHDSFLTEIGPFAHGTFGETHSYGADTQIYFDLVDRVQPDWVVLERAESGLLLPPPSAKPDGFVEIYETDWNSAVGKVAASVATALDWGGDINGLEAFCRGDLDPGHLFVRAKAALSANSVDRALADAAALVEIDPRHAAYHILLARIQSQAFDFVGAAYQAEIAFELAPENAYNAQTLVFSHLRLNDAASAAARFRQASTWIKDDAALYHWGSVALYRNGDTQGALDALHYALQLEPGHPDLLEWLTELRMGAGSEIAARLFP